MLFRSHRRQWRARSFLSTPSADKNTSASKLRDRLHKSALQLRPPNFDSDDATCNFNFGHPTTTSPTQLQLRQRNFNFANATSTSPMQLQLHHCNFNLSKTTSTSLMQLQLCTVNLNFKFESDLHPQVQHLIFMCDGLSPFWLISLQRYA